MEEQGEKVEKNKYKKEKEVAEAQETYKVLGGINMQIVNCRSCIKGTRNKWQENNEKLGGGGASEKVLYGKQRFTQALKEEFDFITG